MVDDISSLLVMLSLTAEPAGIVFVLRTGQRMRASALLLRLAQNSTARCATRGTSLISTFHPASRQASSAFRGSTRASASRPAWWQFPASTEIGDSVTLTCLFAVADPSPYANVSAVIRSVDSPHYHVWTDALYARSLARSAKNDWDLGSHVRWCVQSAWTAFEMAAEDARWRRFRVQHAAIAREDGQWQHRRR